MDLEPRVLHVALSLNPGGTERLVVELARRLHAEIPTSVCCLDDEGAWAGEVKARGILVRALNRRAGFRPSLGRAIAAIAREHGATVIHAHQYSPFVYTCLSRISSISTRTPIVFTEHGRLSDAAPSPKRRMVNGVLRRVPWRVCAVSGDLADHMAAEGFIRTKIDVVYNGVDAGPSSNPEARRANREALNLRPEVFVVGTVARLDPVKDVGTLLQAIAQVTAGAPVHLLVVGDGPDRSRLGGEAERLGLAGRVTFLGARDDAREWLWACDAYVNSSVSEGISLTILEAMAASLPIVATRVGGTPEILDETCGRLVPARNPLALAQAIDALMEDVPGRMTIGAHARRRLEERFTLDRMINEYGETYRRATRQVRQSSA